MTATPRSGRPRSSSLREDRGSATAETAIVLPVIVALVLVIAVAGVGLSLQVQLEAAARAGARELARGESPGSAREAAQRVGGADTQVSIGGDGTWVRVETSRTLHGPAGLLSGARWTLRAEAEARREPHLLEGAALAVAGFSARRRRGP